MNASLAKGLYFDLKSGDLYKSAPNGHRFLVDSIEYLTEEEISSTIVYFDLYNEAQLIDFLGLEN